MESVFPQDHLSENDAAVSDVVAANTDDSLGESQWLVWLNILGLSGAKFLWQKPKDPRQRTYASNGRIYKVYAHVPDLEDAARPKRLEHEYAMIRRCAGIAGVPQALAHERHGPMEITIYRAIDAESLHDRRLTLLPMMAAVFQLAVILARHSWRGIAHNDLTSSNVLFARNGRCYLVDFDLSLVTTRTQAFHRNFIRDRVSRETGFFG